MQRIINEFQEIINNAPAQLASISEQEFAMHKLPGKWSKKQILGHLIDSAANNHQRFIRIQYDHHVRVSYDQDQWNVLSHYNDAPATELISLWASYNLHLLRIIRNIPAENLVKTGLAANDTVYTLEWCIEDYVGHLKHHLAQIMAD